MAYRADIEIGVKGAKQLEEIQKKISDLSKQIDRTNKQESFGSKQVASLDQYSSAVAKATANLHKTRIQLDKNGNATKTYKKAIDQYVTALGAANEAQEITNRQLDREISSRTRATAALKAYNAAAAAPTRRGAATTMAGAYLRGQPTRGRTQYGGPIGPGPASARPFGPIGGPSSSILGGQSVPVEGRIQRALQAQREELALKQALEKLEQRSIANHNQRLNLQAEYTKELRAVTQAARIGPRPAPGFDPAPAAARARLRTAQAEIKRQTIISRTLVTTRQLSGLQQGMVKLAQAEAKARLDSARNTAQQRGELAAAAREQQRINRPIGRQPRDARSDRGRRLREDLALGAGFPLLTGAGPGGVLGGVAGAIAGGGKGGFGLQILFSALGTAVDTFVQKLNGLADGLRSTQGTLSSLEQSGYRVSDVTKSLIASYEKAGLFTDAYALALEEVNRVFGPDGVSKLQAYDQETKKLNEEFQKVTAALQSEMLPALTGLIRLILGVKSAFDAVAESRLGRAIMGAGTALSDMAVPGFARARTAFGLLQQAGAPIGEAGVPDSVRLAQEGRAETKVIAEQEAADAARDRLYVVQAEAEVVQAGNDLLDDSVVKAKEKVIQEQYLAKVRKENVTLEEEQLALAERNLAIGRLRLQVDGARQREAERQRREAERAAKQAERLRKQTEQLRLQSMAATMTREQNQAIAAAQLQGDKREVLRLQILRERLALGLRELQIENEKLPALQQQYKLDIAREQAQDRINKLNNEYNAAQQGIAKAVQSSIAEMDREIALIDATLQGRRKEVELNQEINALVKSTGANTLEQVDSLERMVRLLDERRQAEESFNIQQQTRFAGAGLGAGFIGEAGRKFEETRIGGGSVERATELARLTEEMELAQMVAQNLESSVLLLGMLLEPR